MHSTLFVTLDKLKQIVQDKQLTLCPKCAEHYEPCLAALLYRGAGVMHIMPAVYTSAHPWEDKWMHPFYAAYEDFCCLENRSERYYGIIGLICLSPLYDHDSFRTFLCDLLRQYPSLLNRPITERALHEAGCDLESEWAMWQLANGGGSQQ
jgi:hypothetical protein